MKLLARRKVGVNSKNIVDTDAVYLSDLDHVLYDKRNSTDEEKEEDVYAFAKKYKNNVGAFMDFMCKSAFSVKGDFKGSWEFIETDMHSIERYTNLPICLEGK